MDTLRRGQQFTRTRPPGTTDALGKLIDNALIRLGPDAPNPAVLDHIRDKELVENVDVDWTITWHTPDNRPKTTTFKAFCNRVAARRKALRKK